MKLHSIRVEGFKRFRDALTIDALTPGINLFAAPNGSGKSTLAEAVRVAFLERTRTVSLGASLSPWSQPGAVPSVKIEFENDGKQHVLAKTFGSKKSCELLIGSQKLEGEAAEDAMATLFSFDHAGRGESKPEHQGVPGLLWVRQGFSGEILEQVGHAHDHIRRVLGDLNGGAGLGELAATAGDRVIAHVEEALGRLQTKTGKPTGENSKARDKLAEAQVQLTQQDHRIQEYTATVDQFARLKTEHGKAAQDRPWEALGAKANQAQVQLDGLKGFEAERDQQALRQQVTSSRVQDALREFAAFDAEDLARQEHTAAVATANEKNERAQDEVAAADGLLRRVQDEWEEARTAAAAARQAAGRQARQQELVKAQRRLEEMRGRLLTLRGHEDKRAEGAAAAARLSGFKGIGARLQAAESDVTKARAKLEAVSTRLEYELQGEGLQLDGQALMGAGSQTISEPVEITIAGVGRIRVLPGAAELSTLKAALARAEEHLRALLERVGAASASEARQQEQAWTEARDEAARLAGIIEGLAPEGVAALAEGVREAEGELQQHETVLAGLPEPVGPLQTVEAAEAAEKAAQKAHADAMKQGTSSRDSAAGVAERLRAAKEALQVSQTKVSAPDRAERRRRAGEALLQARAEETGAANKLAELRAKIEQGRPEVLLADIKRLRASADTQSTKHAKDAAELSRLSGLLQAQGALGLAEQHAATEKEVARLQRQVDQYARDAAALAHLLATLIARRDQVARSIRAPLQAHMNHYLGIYQPGMAIELDQQLRPASIARRGLYGQESGEFEALSGGEREQVGIIARLAYADLLREAGKPTLIVLDDSLVNTDQSRLVDMKRVLFDAAERHQILLLTCH